MNCSVATLKATPTAHHLRRIVTHTLDTDVRQVSTDSPETLPAWAALKSAAGSLQTLQVKDGSIAEIGRAHV